MSAARCNGQIEAAFYERQADGSVDCRLCPQQCHILPQHRGRCLGRINYEGTLIAETYARPASVALDPIEKKPLFHIAPGTQILSIGSFGCNLSCRFCQNCELSQQRTPTEHISIDDLVLAAQSRQSVGIAFTYNEPTVWYEFVRDCSEAFHRAGLLTVMVTNGYMNPKPLEALLPFIDGMNIDLKSFRDSFYKEVCGARLQPVLDTIIMASKVCHVELTNLVIPGHNDTEAEQEDMAAWIASEVGSETPLHLSAYFPRHRLQARPTTARDLEQAKARFTPYLKHVYLGNIAIPGAADTHCPACGAIAITRAGYNTNTDGLDSHGKCAACGGNLGIIMPPDGYEFAKHHHSD